MVEITTLVDDDLGHPVPHQHATQGHVATGDAFGKGHQIGLVAHLLVGEPCAQTTKGTNHLVADQQDAELVDDALNLGPIAGWRDDDAARALHRFTNEGGHFVSAYFENFGLELACHADTEIMLRLARQGIFKMVGLVDVNDARDGQVALLVHALHAAQGGAANGGAVVTVVARDDDLAFWLAQAGPVMAHHADVGVVAFRAGTGEEHVRETAVRHLGCQATQFGGQFHGRHIGGVEKAVVVGQLHHLQIGCLGQLLPTVTNVDAPQAAHGVEDFLAFRVPDVDALAPGDDAGTALRQRVGVGEGVQVVGAVELLNLGGIDLASLHLGNVDHWFESHGVLSSGKLRSNVQQQMLTFPWRDDFHEFFKLGFFDLGVDRHEFIAQHLAQIIIAAQPLEGLAQAAWQGVGGQVGVAFHFRFGGQFVFQAKVAAGQGHGQGHIRIGIGANDAVFDATRLGRGQR